MYWILILLLILLFWTLDSNVAHIDHRSSPRPLICILAGTHGNEPAASQVLKYLNLHLTRGTVRILPRLNPFGLRYGIRYQEDGSDLNRSYARLTPKSRLIIELIQDADLVLDFHEGWGFHSCQPASLGSTITPTPELEKLGTFLVNKLNQLPHRPCETFLMLPGESCTIPSTLSCYMEKNRIPYLLVETSGQNNVLPFSRRREQILLIIDQILRRLDMGNIVY